VKNYLLIVLAVSISFNIFQCAENSNLRLKLAQASTQAASYSAILDKYDAEEVQREKITATIRNRNPHIPSLIADQWAGTIQKASRVYRIDTDILLSLYQVESALVHYDARGNLTISNRGAGGLGQIMPFWAKACPHSHSESDLANGSVNIMCSAFILRRYLDENSNNMFLALTAYNAGPRGVRLMEKGLDITNKYAIKILTQYHESTGRTL